MKIPTVKIVNPRSPGHCIVINASEFDETKHTYWTEKSESIYSAEVDRPVAKPMSRAEELNETNWRALKHLYETVYQLGDYPGKDEAIAAILEAESRG